MDFLWICERDLDRFCPSGVIALKVDVWAACLSRFAKNVTLVKVSNSRQNNLALKFQVSAPSILKTWILH